ncbi:MAG TPA: hypothetical protein VGH36_13385 [Acetobacteraceae bacterium]|jgi:hypothetical protein
MRFIVASAIGITALLGTAASHAQTTYAQTPADEALSQSWSGPPASVVDHAPHTLFSIGGVNVVVNAPVDAPDSGIAYRNLEGQPMQSRDAVLAGG